MDQSHYKILEFLARQTIPIKYDKFPQEIQSEFDPYSVDIGSLYYELEFVLKNKKNWIQEAKTANHHFIISPYGQDVLKKEKANRVELLSDGQIKHDILKFLKTDINKWHFLNEIQESFPIDKDRLIYLLDEMKKNRNIEMKDNSTKEGVNYFIRIENKGVEAFAKSEYLKPVSSLVSTESTDFSAQDIDKLNNNINEILEELKTLKVGQEVIWTDVMEELNELKKLYFLNKKNWRQLLIGKLAEMVSSGVVSETISKKIADSINPIMSTLIGN